MAKSKPITTKTKSTEKNSNKKTGINKSQVKSKANKAGITFPYSKTEYLIRANTNRKRISEEAVIFMAALLEKYVMMVLGMTAEKKDISSGKTFSADDLTRLAGEKLLGINFLESQPGNALEQRDDGEEEKRKKKSRASSKSRRQSKN